MGVFSVFTMLVLWRIFRHVLYMTDAVVLNIWLSNIPLIIASLMGLISLPYTINRSTNFLSDLAGMIGQVKSGGAMVRKDKDS